MKLLFVHDVKADIYENDVFARSYGYDIWNERYLPNFSQIKVCFRTKKTETLLIQCAGTIKIGDNVLIARNVSILDYNHGTDPYNANYLDNNLEPRTVVIEDGAWIGNNVIILPGAHIGKKSIIGAGSIVTSHIEEYSIAVGNPARIVKKYNFESKTWQRV